MAGLIWNYSEKDLLHKPHYKECVQASRGAKKIKSLSAALLQKFLVVKDTSSVYLYQYQTDSLPISLKSSTHEVTIHNVKLSRVVATTTRMMTHHGSEILGFQGC